METPSENNRVEFLITAHENLMKTIIPLYLLVLCTTAAIALHARWTMQDAHDLLARTQRNNKQSHDENGIIVLKGKIFNCFSFLLIALSFVVLLKTGKLSHYHQRSHSSLKPVWDENGDNIVHSFPFLIICEHWILNGENIFHSFGIHYVTYSIDDIVMVFVTISK